MSGMTIRQILMATNYWVLVRIEDEFRKVLSDTKIAKDMLEELTDKQLDMTFDYTMTSDYNDSETNVLILGMNSDCVDDWSN